MNSSASLFERATTHHRAGRFSDAERDYLELLNMDSGNADALRLLGALYVQIEQPERAIKLFERAHRSQPLNAETLNNLGVALRNAGRLDDAIKRYEQAVSANPHYIQARQNLGNAYHDRGNALIAEDRRDESGDWFERAVRLDPQNFRALNNLAGIYRNRGRAEEAAALYRQALRLRPNYIEARINLGNALRDLGRPDEAMECYGQALKLNPDSSDALNNLGTLFQDLNRLEEAVEHYDRALRFAPDSPVIKSNKGFALLALGNFAEGWALNEAGLNIKDRRGIKPFSVNTWDGRTFKGKRLLIWSEQGLGDNLQFVRYAAMCRQRGGEVWVQCPQPLARIFKSVPGVDGVVTNAREGDFDHHAMMMSLPHIFETVLETIPATVPYLHVDQAVREKWAPKFAGIEGFKVGLVWAGSSREGQLDAHLIDKRRSMSLSLLKPLLEIDGVQFYSLQMGPPSGQIDEFNLRGRIIDFMPEVGDFLDTAAIIEHLDLVISVDTSVAHLAGALAKPVWILSRFDACWRWLRNRELNSWYPTARIFGQEVAGVWDTVVNKVHEALVSVK